jgi:hypothetical protein
MHWIMISMPKNTLQIVSNAMDAMFRPLRLLTLSLI